MRSRFVFPSSSLPFLPDCLPLLHLQFLFIQWQMMCGHEDWGWEGGRARDPCRRGQRLEWMSGEWVVHKRDQIRIRSPYIRPRTSVLITVCDRKPYGRNYGRKAYSRNVSALFLFRSHRASKWAILEQNPSTFGWDTTKNGKSSFYPGMVQMCDSCDSCSKNVVFHLMYQYLRQFSSVRCSYGRK